MKKKFKLPLINTHCHAAMIGFRGIGEGLSLHNWLYDCIFPAEAEMVNPNFVYEQTKRAITEMRHNGIQAFMDMYYHEEEVARAAEEMKMYVVIGEGLVDVKGQEVFDSDLSRTEKMLDIYSESEYVTPSVAPHSPYTVKGENLVRAKALARKYDALYQIHASETQKEYEDCLALYGMTPIKYLDNLGVLDNKTVLIHCVWLDEEDINIISLRGCKVVHCPLSNLKLGSGISPVSSLLAAGVNVSMGTDGPASSNRLDILEAGKIASLLQKGVNRNPEMITSRQAMDMMTVNGIIALGLEKKEAFSLERIFEELEREEHDYIFHLHSSDLEF